MKISIITVTYNSEKTIERTLQSIEQQTIMPYEYLIVDGVSTDRTLEIAEKYRGTFEKKKIRYFIYSSPDDGIYDAMNKGIQLATGDYVAMLNSDDWYEKTTIETVYGAYQKEEFEMAYGSIGYIGKKGRVLIKKSKLDSFVSSRNWNHPSTFVKREISLKYPFDLNFKIYADFDWYLKLRKENVKILIFPKRTIIANFCIGGASINENFLSILERGREKYEAYRKNGYSRLYIVEAYGWEIMKYCFAKIYG